MQFLYKGKIYYFLCTHGTQVLAEHKTTARKSD
jgi:hypothetical protein